MMEADFRFAQMLRWNLGWATPNYAGAFVAMLICVTWVFQVRGFYQGIQLGIETAGYCLLCKTYSRGALVALVIGSTFFLLVTGARATLISRRLWLGRGAMLALAIIGTGFFGRVDPREVAHDKSITNRLELWRGGVEMARSSPVRGWGGGESGRGYMNWFQPLSDTPGNRTMVNSYLDVAVCYGGFGLAGVISLGTALIVAAARMARTESDPLIYGGAGACLVAWATANVFSTLWVEPLLWILPGTVASWIFLETTRSSRRTHMLAIAGSVIAAAAVLAGYCGSGSSIGREGIAVQPVSDGMVVLRNTMPPVSGHARAQSWHMWLDPLVLGPTPGKEVRRWVGKHETEVIVSAHPFYSAAFEGSMDAEAEGVFVFGSQAARLERGLPLARCRELWIIHPTAPPPRRDLRDFAAKTIVLLPGVDETGSSSAWRLWAAQAGATLTISGSTGLDIRNAWPDCALIRPAAISAEQRISQRTKREPL